MKHSITLMALLLASVAAGQAQQATVGITPELTAAVQKYDIVQNFSEGLAPVCKGGKWGYINAQGQEVIAPQVPAKFDLCSDRLDYGFFRDGSYVRNYSDGMVALPKEVSGAKQSYDRQLKWAYYDQTGKQVTDYIYDEAADFSEGLAWVSNETTHGFIDKSGKLVIDGTKYYSEELGELNYTFHEGLCCVAKTVTSAEGDVTVKWGYIDKTGQEVIPCKWDQAKPFSQGRAAVAVNRDDLDALYPVAYSYLNRQGEDVITMPAGKECGNFSEGLASVTTDGQKFGFVDTTGHQVIAEDYYTDDTAMPVIMADYQEGYTLIGSDMTVGDHVIVTFRLMDHNGQALSQLVNGPVTEGLVLVAKANKLGFAKPDGTEVIPCQYDYTPTSVGGELIHNTYRFSQGLAAVRQDGHWGYVNPQAQSTFKK